MPGVQSDKYETGAAPALESPCGHPDEAKSNRFSHPRR